MIHISEKLNENKSVFLDLLKDIKPEMIHWRPQKDKWSLLDIVCHLYDEERDDFRFRVRWLLEKPGETPPPFNPLEWVKTRDYANQDYVLMLQKFIKEREASVLWLNTLKNPNWDNAFEHISQGPLSARYFLNNWLAHDYLHMRQIIKQKFDYLEQETDDNLNYAGAWQ